MEILPTLPSPSFLVSTKGKKVLYGIHFGTTREACCSILKLAFCRHQVVETPLSPSPGRRSGLASLTIQSGLIIRFVAFDLLRRMKLAFSRRWNKDDKNKHRQKLFQPAFLPMSGAKKRCKAATPRFINSPSEFIDVFMSPFFPIDTLPVYTYYVFIYGGGICRISPFQLTRNS